MKDNITRIMFVCHGNICRSPMAEIIFRDMLRGAGLDRKITVASSATSTEEIWNGVGNPVYPPARAVLEARGLSCEGKRAVQLKKADYGSYDLFIGMDSANIRNMLRIFGGDPDSKIIKLLDLTKKGGDVADPWYTRNFDATLADITLGCEALFRLLS